MASTPAATSRRHCLSLALASLILADVSGQIIFIPTSMMSSPSSSSSFFSYPSSPSSSSPRGLLLGGGSVGIASSSTYDEPPCRQRRLEPFRQLVREECRADAEAHCRGGGGNDGQAAAALDLSSLILPPMSLGGGRDEDWKRMGSLLDAIFAPPPSSSYQAGDSGNADPFERMFEEMMNWSLSAFDQASSSSSSSALTAAAAEEEGKAASTDTRAEEDASSSSSALTAAADDDWVYSIAPEVAAENALDVAVAELARRSIHRAGSEDGAAVPAVAAPRALPDVGELHDDDWVAEQARRSIPWPGSEDGAAVPAVAAPRALPDVGELHDRLFRLGSGLLSEAHGKRRLLEAGGEADVVAVDPRARTKERLARRLTEYRTDLFYHPDGTVTVYTRSRDPRRPPRPAAADARPPLGFGDDRVDECMTSRHANGDLRGGCHEAVDAFSRATADRTLVVGGVVARSRSFAPPPAAAADADSSSSAQVILLEVVFYILVSLSAAFLVVALIIDWVRNSYDDGEEEEGGDEDEDEGGFDYEVLQEGDRDLVDRDRRERGEEALTPCVYVGVPVQVV